eukprot:scaffold438298_cov37-Prasinocladus_malaysianus.AAC.2
MVAENLPIRSAAKHHSSRMGFGLSNGMGFVRGDPAPACRAGRGACQTSDTVATVVRVRAQRLGLLLVRVRGSYSNSYSYWFGGSKYEYGRGHEYE